MCPPWRFFAGTTTWPTGCRKDRSTFVLMPLALAWGQKIRLALIKTKQLVWQVFRPNWLGGRFAGAWPNEALPCDLQQAESRDDADSIPLIPPNISLHTLSGFGSNKTTSN